MNTIVAGSKNQIQRSQCLGGLSVIILTYNEEMNINFAIESVLDIADQIFVLDSFSTDRTIEIASRYGAYVYKNKFENYAKQRNFALDSFPINTEWVFFLDADEWLSSELKDEIRARILTIPKENGFYIKRRLVWMGQWIRRGYYPSWQLRLFRYGYGRCEDRSINEHFLVDGEINYLQNDFTDENRKGVSDWISKHNNYSSREAHELFNLRTRNDYQEINTSFFGPQAQRRRWLRYMIWNNLPPLIRPFFYFVYRYILLGGFMDGRQAFIFHFLQALWYPLLIDIKYIEEKMKASNIHNEGV